ncbi:thermonuclease family protein [bacterium]|nr:thermonuclease family protein [bacterium]
MEKVLRLFIYLLLILLVCFAAGCRDTGPSIIDNNGGFEIREIIYVIDGDTIILDENETIRLVGIDTPEMSPNPPEVCAEEAKEFTYALANGKECYLVYNTSVGDSIDYYGRTLGFVHLLPDSACLNVEIVRFGWSDDWDAYPVREDYEELFEEAEEEAIEEGRGIWDPEENCGS